MPIQDDTAINITPLPRKGDLVRFSDDGVVKVTKVKESAYEDGNGQPVLLVNITGLTRTQTSMLVVKYYLGLDKVLLCCGQERYVYSNDQRLAFVTEEAKSSHGASPTHEKTQDVYLNVKIGTTVRRHFVNDGWHNGQVDVFNESLPEAPFHVSYPDGDQEHLSFEEVQEGIIHFKNNTEFPPAFLQHNDDISLGAKMSTPDESLEPAAEALSAEVHEDGTRDEVHGDDTSDEVHGDDTSDEVHDTSELDDEEPGHGGGGTGDNDEPVLSDHSDCDGDDHMHGEFWEREPMDSEFQRPSIEEQIQEEMTKDNELLGIQHQFIPKDGFTFSQYVDEMSNFPLAERDQTSIVFPFSPEKVPIPMKMMGLPGRGTTPIRFLEAKVTSASDYCRGQFYLLSHKNCSQTPIIAFVHCLVEGTKRTGHILKPARPIVSLFPSLVDLQSSRGVFTESSILCVNLRSLKYKLSPEIVMGKLNVSSRDLLTFVREESGKFHQFFSEPCFLNNCFDYNRETPVCEPDIYDLGRKPSPKRGVREPCPPDEADEGQPAKKRRSGAQSRKAAKKSFEGPLIESPSALPPPVPHAGDPLLRVQLEQLQQVNQAQQLLISQQNRRGHQQVQLERSDHFATDSTRELHKYLQYQHSQQESLLQFYQQESVTDKQFLRDILVADRERQHKITQDQNEIVRAVLTQQSSHPRSMQAEMVPTLSPSQSKPLLQWTTTELCEWLRTIGVPNDCIQRTMSSAFNGAAFSRLERSDLETLLGFEAATAFAVFYRLQDL